MTRVCGECTACCEGALNTNVLGRQIFRGQPCHFLTEKGCGIYNERPYEPCQRYRCAWLIDDGTDFPEWLRPDRSNVIPSFMTYGEDKKPWLRVSEHKGKIDSNMLNWYFRFAMTNNIPLGVQIDGWWNYYGPEDFVKSVEKTSRVVAYD